MSDRIARGLAPDQQLLAVACIATDTTHDARRRHALSASSAALLGETLCAGLLMAALQKGDQRVNLQVGCEGPAGGVFVDAGAQGDVRGYIRNAHLNYAAEPRLDSARLIGQEGYLAVMRERNGEFYRGVVGLETGNLTLDLEHYYKQSEQTPTTLEVACFASGEEQVGWVGGVLVQCLPGGDEDALEQVRARLKNGALEHVVRTGEASAHALLKAALSDATFDLLADHDASFSCRCSHKRVVRALGTIEPSEIEAMIVEDGKAEATCEFCASRYLVTRDELHAILAEVVAKRAAAPS